MRSSNQTHPLPMGTVVRGRSLAASIRGEGLGAVEEILGSFPYSLELMDEFLQSFEYTERWPPMQMHCMNRFET